jgi:hypothetical protein
MRLILLAAAIFFELYAYAGATAIVAIWYPTFVIIGADGREVTNYGPPLDVCKTSVVGSVAVTEAGWFEFGDKDNVTRFDTITREQLNQDGPISNRVTLAEKAIFNTIKGIDDQRKVPGSPPLDPQFLSSQHFFAYDEGGRMVADFYVAAFDSGINGIGEQRMHCPSAECAPGTVFALGRVAEIEQILRSYSTPPTRLEIVGRIRDIIKRVAQRLPDVVGGSVSILEITPDGHKWIEDGKCSDSN